MSLTLSAERVELMDGRVFFNCTVVLDTNYLLLEYPEKADEGQGKPDRVDEVLPWHQIKRVLLR